jgi:PAT family beta-lactamase induction signal transducer AmpG
MTVSGIMYKRLGISNTDIALYTSWLYLPWVIKPLWSPIVDMLKTKRWWIIVMQLLVGAGLAGVAFSIPVHNFFQVTLACFWLLAFSSATHDIAADGFYMLALDEHKQAYFIGIRSTFYRIAMITGQGLLIILAGFFETYTGIEPVTFSVTAGPNIPSEITVPQFYKEVSRDEVTFFLTSENINVSTQKLAPKKIDSIKQWAEHHNLTHGFVQPQKADEISRDSWFSSKVSGPLSDELKSLFGRDAVVKSALDPGNVGVVGVKTAFFEGRSGNIPLAWSITFFILTGMFLLFFVYHRFFLPRSNLDKPTVQGDEKRIFSEFFITFKAFFQKKNIGPALGFLLLFRLGESQIVKLASPFMLDAREVGGLGLTTGDVGWIYGTIGILALTLGGVLGGLVASRKGLKYWLWPMAIAMNVPNLGFVYLSYAVPQSMWLISGSVALEQFGYGFGFTAYMLFMIYFSDGRHKTAHYAISTGLMALGMMLPGMISGWIQEIVGYHNFFIWVFLCTIPGFLLLNFLKVDASFGIKKKDRSL